MNRRSAVWLGALLATVCAGSGADPALQRTNPPSASEALTPAQVMDRYAAAQRRLYRSFVSRFESDSEGYINHHTVLEPGRRKSHETVEIRTDGRRYYWSEERSGQCFPRLSETTPGTDPRVEWFLFDGQLGYRSGHEPLWMIRQVVQKRPASERSKALHDRLAVTISDRLDTASEFARQFRIGDRQSPDFLPDSLATGGWFAETGLIPKLRKAPTLALEPKPAPVDGVPCYVLKASVTETRTDAQGQRHVAEHVYRLHFDPAHEFHIVKLELTVSHRNLAGAQQRRSPHLIEKRTVDNVRFQQIGDAWVPMAWQWSVSARRLDDPRFSQWEKSQVRRTRVLLAPDHDALGSFRPTWIQDGWTVLLQGFGNRFERAGALAWKGGHVVDQAGQRIDLR